MGTTLDNHGRQFRLHASRQIDLHQLVTAFFKVDTGHDCQVDSSTKIDQVSVGLILNIHLLFFGIGFILGTLILVLTILILIAVLAENLGLQLLIFLLVLLPVWIELENVQSVHCFDFIIQPDLMCDLVLFFHQIELLLNRWIILIPVLAYLEQYFNHVLHALVDIGFVEDVSELVENRICDLRVHLLQVLSNFSGQADGDFHAIVGGLVKQQQQDLCDKHLVGDLIVDKVCNEGRGRDADSFVISLERLAELNNQPRYKKFSNLRQLCVHNGGHRRVDGRKWQTGGLRLHDRSAEQPTATNQILTKKLRHDILDIRDIDLVDQTVDRLLQRLPRHTLVLLAGLIGDLRL